MSTRISLAALAVAMLAAAGCRPDDLTSPSAPGVVATVELAHGGAVTFLDLGDGHIGLAEQAPAAAAFVAVPMVQRQQATPLEVYLAFRPDWADLPDRLVRDHQRLAMARGGSPGPRLLAAPAAGASAFDDPGHGSYTCEHTGVQWVADWKAAFAGITKYRAAAYLHNYPPAYFFYPGAPVYYGTNTNSKTYLGVCNGDDEHELRLEVHRWISGKWKWILTAAVQGGVKYTFYSGIPARYRGKTYGAGGETVEHYGVGAAWSLSPGEATPQTSTRAAAASASAAIAVQSGTREGAERRSSSTSAVPVPACKRA